MRVHLLLVRLVLVHRLDAGICDVIRPHRPVEISKFVARSSGQVFHASSLARARDVQRFGYSLTGRTKTCSHHLPLAASRSCTHPAALSRPKSACMAFDHWLA